LIGKPLNPQAADPTVAKSSTPDALLEVEVTAAVSAG
jgi:hypothetical protein